MEHAETAGYKKPSRAVPRAAAVRPRRKVQAPAEARVDLRWKPGVKVRRWLQAARCICLNFHASKCLWHRRQVYGEWKKNVDKWPSNQLEHAINHWSANNTSRTSCERSLRCHHVSCSAKQSKQNMLGIGLWEKHLSVLIKN